MTLNEIARVVGVDSVDIDVKISMLSIDTRKVRGEDNELFFALKGQNRDGHLFIQEAFLKGVRNFIVEKKPSNVKANFLVVHDSLHALQKIAIYHRQKFDIPVVGITGSNGKTIIKEWLSTILNYKFQVVKSPKSYNSQVGVPLSVWQIDKNHELGIFEAGISQPGEMEVLQKIIDPEIGIFTNIGTAHEEGFDSMEAKIEEKLRLFMRTKKLIYCKDHTLVDEALNENSNFNTISWSFKDQQADYFVASGDHRLLVKGDKGSFDFSIKPYSGIFLENLTHAIIASLELGLDQNEIQKGVNQIKPIAMRLELKRGKNNIYILDDAYNNDLSGLAIALDYLDQQRQTKKTTVIISDLLQIRENHEQVYKEVNKLLENHRVNRVIGIGKEIAHYQHVFQAEFIHFENTDQFLTDQPYFGDEMVLVKGARSFQFEKIIAVLEEKSHGTVLEVNFEALIHNLNIYRSKIHTDVKLMVMVKAMAYGGGIHEIGRLLEYQKIDYLGVAYIDEALELRSHRIQTPIMVLNPDPDQLALVQGKNIEPEVYNWKMLKAIAALDEPPKFHLKIETGMNRLGFTNNQLGEVVRFIKERPNLCVRGVFTHLSAAEDTAEDIFTKNQLVVFEEAYNKVASTLEYQPMKHCLNSAGIIRWPQYQFDLVRLGIGLYGYDSSQLVNDLKPISKLKATVSQIRDVKKGESIGYGRNGRMPENGTIATVSIGYADGYARAFGNGEAYMLINEQKAYTIGHVCMDMTILNVTGLQIEEGDEVIVFGEDPSIEQLAKWMKTIPYEILTNINQRVKRVYTSE